MNNLRRQGAWYIFAGASAALLELSLFTALATYTYIGIAGANVVATIVATVYNFAINRNVTFQSASNPLRSALLYILLFLMNMGLSTIAISLMVSIGAPPFFAKAIMQVCVMIWNFFLYRRLVFK